MCWLAKDKKLGSYKPTHVVTAITYGGNAHIEFKKVKLFFHKTVILSSQTQTQIIWTGAYSKVTLLPETLTPTP